MHTYTGTHRFTYTHAILTYMYIPLWYNDLVCIYESFPLDQSFSNLASVTFGLEKSLF